jgi:hypothetical protein
MRPHFVIMPPPAFDDDLCLLERIEYLSVQQFVAELRVEALSVAVFPGAAGLDIGGLGPDGSDPILHGLGDELGPIAPEEGFR